MNIVYGNPSETRTRKETKNIFILLGNTLIALASYGQ